MSKSPADLVASGQQEYLQGHLDKALQAFSQAIDAAPDRADAWNARALVNSRQGNMMQAILDLEEAARRDTANWRYRNNLGVAHLKLGRLTEALASFDQAVALEPQVPIPLIHRALAYRRLGQLEHALSDLNAALMLDDRNTTAYVNRATVYAYLQRFAEAKADLEQALLLDPSIQQAYESRGLIRMLEGQFALATKDWTKAVELGSTDQLTYYNRGVAFSMIGEASKAQEDYRQSCRRGYAAACPFSPLPADSANSAL